ncbi:MAG TPA: thioredoxin family protein [Bacteroidota bacterium]|jgi:hypothetical protein|nr:thioredoxin family protein [Bacteroidota bacterium]
MIVKVVGWYCPRTEQTLINAQAALRDFDRRSKVEWVSDQHAMIALGIRHTPTLFVNGKLRSASRVPSVHEISLWIEEELVDEFAEERE